MGVTGSLAQLSAPESCLSQPLVLLFAGVAARADPGPWWPA